MESESVSSLFRKNVLPPPHLNAQYGEFDTEIDIETGKQIKGNLPSRADALHSEKLKNMWKTQQIRQLPPLE